MFDTDIIREKLDQASQILAEFDVGVWLTFVRETSMQTDPVLELILGTDVTWSSAFLLHRSGRHTAIVGHYDAENVRQLGLYDRVITYHHGMGDLLRDTLDELFAHEGGSPSIAINYSEADKAADGLSHGMYLGLESLLRGSPHATQLVSAERVIGALRGRKSVTEIERVRQAIAVTESLFEEVDQFVQPGMTQAEIAAFVQGRIDSMQLGYAWPKAYNPIVTCGPQSAIGHAAPGDVVLQKGHTLHLDLGVRRHGYCSDLQRMWYVLDDGESSAPPEVQRAFDVVYGAIRAGDAYLRPGIPGWQVDAVARDFIVDHGYPEYMHAFGHQLGRSAHDGTTLLGPQWERYAGICELEVEAGNIFTLELHVEIPGRGIMSLEEDVLVTDEGVEYLSNPQSALRYISPR